jgi:hypothetical protein
MKYKIVNYDHNRLVIDAQVLESQDPEVFSAVYPISVEGIYTVEQMEKAIYDTWYRNLPPAARGDYSADVLAHVTQTLNTVNTSTGILPNVAIVGQSSQPIGQVDSTSTVNIRII